MRKKAFIMLVAAIVLAIYACGNKKTEGDNADADSTVVEVEEDGGLQPPFMFKTSLYTVKIYKDGDAIVEYIYMGCNKADEATWSSLSLPKGEGLQKVYQINWAGYTWYAPDDMKYIWMGEDAHYDMLGHNIDNAVKIESFKSLPKNEQPATYMKVIKNGVDLGLSVKWASCNLGASSPEEYGNYYAWAETKPRTGSSWDYKWNTTPYYLSGSGNYNDDVKWRKYTGKDGKTVLDASDDAATVALGSPWRIPTFDEIKELYNKCKWTWTSMNGNNGFQVTGPNGNSIFLPAAGYRNGSGLYYAGAYGSYWSSSLYTGSPYSAYSLYFSSSSRDWYYFSGYRCNGRSVRPVRP